MTGKQSSLKYIYKINSIRLRNNNWQLNITPNEARDNEEVVSITDSETIRFIRDINQYTYSEDEVNEIKKQINSLKKEKSDSSNIKKIKRLYDQLDKILFTTDYVNIIMDRNSDYDRLNKGFFINGIKYRRLLATTGGGKKSTVVYVSNNVHSELSKRIENGRDTTKELVAGKLEAYKALTCSASIPMINTRRILVVNDCITKFKEDVITIDDRNTKYPKVKLVENMEHELQDSDGYGLISPDFNKIWSDYLELEYQPSGYCLRNSFCKGMLFTFDFKEFAKQIANENITEDVWGDKRDINEIDIILTTSMLKLWSSYKNLDDYLDNCEENKYNFSITKVTPERLEDERNLNYQFIQSLYLNDEDIEELIRPTVNEIKDVLCGDYRKSILFLRGNNINEENVDIGDYDFIKALMIDKRMIEDPFVKNSIHKMIKKRINDAKLGVLKINGNFSVVSGDPYSLCQSIFEIQVTGLLKKGEFYSNYWNEKNVKKVACFRAPMTCHNNIRILNLKTNQNMEYWYQYMKTITIFNSWDTTAFALNGLDKDGDTVLTTNNQIVLKGIRQAPAIVCMQKTAEKKIVEEADLIQANKNSFGDEIGSITNRITAMFDVLSGFEENTDEHNELLYRISCGQNYQQNAIDKSKGIISKSMPKEWYDYKINKINNEKDDKELKKKKQFNLQILADKKPYFFIYRYPEEKKKYEKYLKQTNKNCLGRFGLDVAELISKENKTDEELLFLKYYYQQMPVFMNASVMNKICWRIEQIFYNYLKEKIKTNKFNYEILKTNAPYVQRDYKKILELYKEYQYNMQQYSQMSRDKNIDKNERQNKRNIFKSNFKRKAFEICNNEDEVCDIILDICYNTNHSKQFAWDIIGKTIIRNLLDKNNYTYYYPILDNEGDIEFCGQYFSMKQKQIKTCEEIYEDNNQ